MNVLHISDIHYGTWTFESAKGPESTHFFSKKDVPNPKSLAEILLRDWRSAQPDLLIISGDVGWSGSDSDYDYAKIFLATLKSKWSAVPLVVIPGNHDVDLTPSLHNDCRQDNYISFIRSIHGPLFSRLYPIFDNGKDRRNTLVTVHHDPNNILVVGINSAASINASRDPILIQPSVFSLLDDYLQGLGIPNDLLKLFVVHHHLLPFAEPDWATTLDAEIIRERPDNTIVANSARLQDWLATNGFHVVLHGHKHTFHGREDFLWRHDSSSSSRRLLILGAGSAGVTRREMAGGEPHSLNKLSIVRKSSRAWQVSATVSSITGSGAVFSVKPLREHRCSVGVEPDRAPRTYHSDRMDLCHGTICTELRGHGPVRNFISIVEDSCYHHPDTAHVSTRAATKADVERSFVALHPEWDSENGWSDLRKVDGFLKRLGDSYRIQHGPRLFRKTGQKPAAWVINGTELRPIMRAVNALKTKTRAYVGLYDPETDGEHDWRPLPGLVGVQFVPDERDNGRIDIVCTFRNLELSFWWSVNMLVASRLLSWACMCAGSKFRPGRISFFSAVAEWRHDDARPLFISRIDEMMSDELFALVVSAAAGSSSSISILKDLLEAKIIETTDLNIDCTGLEKLLGLSRGVLRHRRKGSGSHSARPSKSPINDAFVGELAKVIDELQEAIEAGPERTSRVDVAKHRLDRIVKSIA